jgi:hypothetical protein
MRSLCHNFSAQYFRYPYRDILLNTPWTTAIHKPGQTWAELRKFMEEGTLNDGTKVADYWDHKDYSHRVFKAHEVI